MPNVYVGRYLRLNLTTGEHRVESIAEADVKTYLLGSGYAAKLFYDEMDPAIDPLVRARRCMSSTVCCPERSHPPAAARPSAADRP